MTYSSHLRRDSKIIAAMVKELTGSGWSDDPKLNGYGSHFTMKTTLTLRELATGQVAQLLMR